MVNISELSFIYPYPPEVDIYYRGKSGILEGTIEVEVLLSEYVSNLYHNFNVQITHIYDGKNKVYSYSEV